MLLRVVGCHSRPEVRVDVVQDSCVNRDDTSKTNRPLEFLSWIILRCAEISLDLDASYLRRVIWTNLAHKDHHRISVRKRAVEGIMVKHGVNHSDDLVSCGWSTVFVRISRD